MTAVALHHPDPELGDDVIRLRRWEVGDLACVREAGADPAVRPWTTLPDPRTWSEGEGRAYVERQWSRLARGSGMSLAVTLRDGDRAVGQVGLGVRPQEGVVGLGYWIVGSARRRGLGGAAARLLSTWALGPGGAARVEAWVQPGNEASLRVLAAAGFTREGLLRSFLTDEHGERHDMVVLSRVQGDG